MKVWIEVEDFAKIRHAKVCMNQYTLLVGQNNSGKTFLMQLVQGIGQHLKRLYVPGMIDMSWSNEKEKAEGRMLIDNAWVRDILVQVNQRLDEEKQSIIREIYNKNIPIKTLRIDVDLEDTCFEIRAYRSIPQQRESIQAFMQDSGFHPRAHDWLKMMLENEAGIFSAGMSKNTKTLEKKGFFMSWSMDESSLEKKFYDHACNMIFDLSDSLFLPASRTGMMMLYRNFFAQKVDDTMQYVQDGAVVPYQDDVIGMTKPMYEFMRFLQTYVENENELEKHKKELDFFENHLIEGHISWNRQGSFTYDATQGAKGIPMYLASSMINEVAPMILAITGQKNYGRLIIDEVDASLHPEKQQELVRFLTRLNNTGMQLMISTHSDTFVSKLNNLYKLSGKSDAEDLLASLNLEKEDIPRPSQLNVYEFVNQPDGTSEVYEIEGDVQNGFQFGLFAKSAWNLYQESAKIQVGKDK